MSNFNFQLQKLRPLPWLMVVLASLFALAGSHSARADNNYKLAPGDVVTVTVQRHPEMSVENATVNPAGKIKVPDVGEVSVTGKTLDQAAHQVARALDSQLVQPQVTISLKQARPLMVSVLGVVGKPGVYQSAPGWRVTEALGVAGGLTIRPQLANATLTRANGKIINLDLQQIFRESQQPGSPANNSTANLLLQPGDVLNFSSRAVQVSVTGEVQHPGIYEVPVGDGVVEAIALAGGPTPKAALSKARITRADGTNVPTDLVKAIIQGDPDSNIKLGVGDLILVPQSNDHVTVRGAVQKPGYYDIPDGTTMRVTQAVDMAGGPLPKAGLSKAAIEHADGTTTPVNLYKVFFQGQRDQDVNLVPGDIVTVPEARGVTVLGDVKTPGTYTVAGDNSRLSDVLAMGGGLTGKTDAARISVTHTSVDNQIKTVDVDAVKLLDAKDPTQNEPITDGDLVMVSSLRAQTVFVSGEVKTPGSYDLVQGGGVAELIARAGGPTDEAALKRVSVRHRDSTVATVDAYNAVHEGGQNANFPLLDGDFIVVPKNTAHVLIMPAVNKPGSYAIPENEPLTIGKALALAGGPKDRAKVKQIAVFRHTKAGVQHYVFNISQVVNGRTALDQVLQDQDVLYVPEGKQTESALNSIANAIGSIGVLAAVL